MKKYIFDKKGQTLLEALIALSILVVILGAVATSVLTSINNSSFVKQQNQANKLAQQGIEYIRDRINNSGTNTFSIYNGSGYSGYTKCLDANNVFQDRTCDCSPAHPNDCIGGLFKREATFSLGHCGANLLTSVLPVTVNVYWTDGKCTVNSFCHSQKVTSCFIDPAQSLPAGGQPGI